MNNPDEDTAVAQFGKDDKYFGVATMLATMPGLPMFGHGQIEGFTEKYGMEYRRAYCDETPDEWLVRRHEREIFPLLHKRYLFAEVDNFRLYDFFSADGGVNEDVFAYSNRSGDERALVIFHNKWADARGWIRTSAAYAVKEGDGNKRLEQADLAYGLGLPSDPAAYVIFRDVASNLEYIRNCQQLHNDGMYIELGAFKYHVFLDFKVVHEDADGRYGHLMGYLAGRGVPSIEEALAEIFLQPVLDPFRRLINAETLAELVEVAMPVTLEVAEMTAEDEDGDEVSELDVEIIVEADLESPDVLALLDDAQDALRNAVAGRGRLHRRWLRCRGAGGGEPRRAGHPSPSARSGRAAAGAGGCRCQHHLASGRRRDGLGDSVELALRASPGRRGSPGRRRGG